MQMRAFDPEKCGSGKKNRTRFEGKCMGPYQWPLDATVGIYLSGCGVGARKMLHKSSSSLRTPTQSDSMGFNAEWCWRNHHSEAKLGRPLQEHSKKKEGYLSHSGCFGRTR